MEVAKDLMAKNLIAVGRTTHIVPAARLPGGMDRNLLKQTHRLLPQGAAGAAKRFARHSLT
jgi:hypothetical protein